ncbi:MAG: hypothetical protein Q7T50_03610 [Candidatus Magasanikbacteria bacterium]|nr:hypothetical protein [Candidatus Magasanikbacteria bacterium]
MPKNTKIIKVKNFALTEAELKKLAHSATKEAIAKIEKYMKSEKDLEKKAMAEMYLEECEFFYYQPTNNKEEQAFTLCVLINDREKKLSTMEMEISKIESKLEIFELEQAVHAKVLAKHKNKVNDWQYRYTDDFMVFEHNKLEELKDNLVYEKAWIEAAKKMISISKYKNCIPDRHLSHFDFAFNDRDNDDKCDCCNDDCSDWRNDEIIREDLMDDCPF